jgi:hypothetical protein
VFIEIAIGSLIFKFLDSSCWVRIGSSFWVKIEKDLFQNVMKSEVSVLMLHQLDKHFHFFQRMHNKFKMLIGEITIVLSIRKRMKTEMIELMMKNMLECSLKCDWMM